MALTISPKPWAIAIAEAGTRTLSNMNNNRPTMRLWRDAIGEYIHDMRTVQECGTGS